MPKITDFTNKLLSSKTPPCLANKYFFKRRAGDFLALNFWLLFFQEKSKKEIYFLLIITVIFNAFQQCFSNAKYCYYIK